jgi:hypothetical protein
MIHDEAVDNDPGTGIDSGFGSKNGDPAVHGLADLSHP